MSTWASYTIAPDEWDVSDDGMELTYHSDDGWMIHLRIKVDRWVGRVAVALGECDTAIYAPDFFYDLASDTLTMDAHPRPYALIPPRYTWYDVMEMDGLPSFDIPAWFADEVEYQLDRAARAEADAQRYDA